MPPKSSVVKSRPTSSTKTINKTASTARVLRRSPRLIDKLGISSLNTTPGPSVPPPRPATAGTGNTTADQQIVIFTKTPMKEKENEKPKGVQREDKRPYTKQTARPAPSEPAGESRPKSTLSRGKTAPLPSRVLRPRRRDLAPSAGGRLVTPKEETRPAIQKTKIAANESRRKPQAVPKRRPATTGTPGPASATTGVINSAGDITNGNTTKTDFAGVGDTVGTSDTVTKGTLATTIIDDAGTTGNAVHETGKSEDNLHTSVHFSVTRLKRTVPPKASFAASSASRRTLVQRSAGDTKKQLIATRTQKDKIPRPVELPSGLPRAKIPSGITSLRMSSHDTTPTGKNASGTNKNPDRGTPRNASGTTPRSTAGSTPTGRNAGGTTPTGRSTGGSTPVGQGRVTSYGVTPTPTMTDDTFHDLYDHLTCQAKDIDPSVSPFTVAGNAAFRSPSSGRATPTKMMDEHSDDPLDPDEGSFMSRTLRRSLEAISSGLSGFLSTLSPTGQSASPVEERTPTNTKKSQQVPCFPPPSTEVEATPPAANNNVTPPRRENTTKYSTNYDNSPIAARIHSSAGSTPPPHRILAMLKNRNQEMAPLKQLPRPPALHPPTPPPSLRRRTAANTQMRLEKPPPNRRPKPQTPIRQASPTMHQTEAAAVEIEATPTDEENFLPRLSLINPSTESKAIAPGESPSTAWRSYLLNSMVGSPGGSTSHQNAQTDIDFNTTPQNKKQDNEVNTSDSTSHNPKDNTIHHTRNMPLSSPLLTPKQDPTESQRESRTRRISHSTGSRSASEPHGRKGGCCPNGMDYSGSISLIEKSYFTINPGVLDDDSVWRIENLKHLCGQLSISTEGCRTSLVNNLKEWNKDPEALNALGGSTCKKSLESPAGILSSTNNFHQLPIMRKRLPSKYTRILGPLPANIWELSILRRSPGAGEPEKPPPRRAESLRFSPYNQVTTFNLSEVERQEKRMCIYEIAAFSNLTEKEINDFSLTLCDPTRELAGDEQWEEAKKNAFKNVLIGQTVL